MVEDLVAQKCVCVCSKVQFMLGARGFTRCEAYTCAFVRFDAFLHVLNAKDVFHFDTVAASSAKAVYSK